MDEMNNLAVKVCDSMDNALLGDHCKAGFLQSSDGENVAKTLTVCGGYKENDVAIFICGRVMSYSDTRLEDFYKDLRAVCEQYLVRVHNVR